MCTGAEPALLYASLAATAAGTAASVSAQHKQRQAAQQAAQQDLARKQVTSKQAQDIFQTELQNSNVGDAQKTADTEAAAQLQQTQGLVNRPDTGFVSATETPGMASATPVVKEAAARTLADELARTEGQMKARSELQGYQQRFLNRGIQFGRGADQMQLLGNYNRGWDQVAQTEQEMAKYAGAKQAMLGDLLTGVGSMGTQYSTAKGASLFGNAASGGGSLSSAGGPYGYTSTMPSQVGSTNAATGFRRTQAPTRFGGYF